MKLKHRPDDFLVEERLGITPGDRGRFALYSLEKENLGTPEAVAAIARRWQMHPERLAVAGLKDKHALTRQALSIENGPRRDLQQSRLRCRYLGQIDRPVTSRDIVANHFRIVLRDLDGAQSERLPAAVEALAADGLPNYFDRQRFGSLGASRQFMAAAWCAKDYQRAIWLVLADESASDRGSWREEKAILREHWGDWKECLGQVLQSPAREVIEHLYRRPGDFRGAITRLPQESRRLWIEAFQSWLWNRLLAAWLRRRCTAEQCAPLSIAGEPLVLPHNLDDAQRAAFAAAELPLPTARVKSPEGLDDEVAEALAPTGFQWRQIRIDYPRDSFFSKGGRAAWFTPAQVACALSDDEDYPERQKATLEFDLPRGCYATIVVQRLAAAEVE